MSACDRYDWLTLSGELAYSFTIDKFEISPKAGIYWDRSVIDSRKSVLMSPLGQVYINYRPNSRHSLQLFSQYKTDRARPTMKSPDTFRENELLYYAGDAELRPSKNVAVSLSYGFLPNNNFGMYAYGMYQQTFDKATTRYEPWLDGKALRRVYWNNGDYINCNAGIRFTYALLKRSLRFSLNPSVNVDKLTGDYTKRLTTFNLSASASYYIRNFYFSAFWSLPQKMIDEVSNTVIRQRPNYYLQAGWGNGRWNIRVTAYKIFNKGWKSGTSEIDMPLYYSKTTRYGQNGHASIAVAASYTFGYGKRVERGDEVGAIGRGESAILK